MADKVHRTGIPPTSPSGDSGYSRSASASALSFPTSMKEVGEYLVELAPRMLEVQNERDQLRAEVKRLKDLCPQLPNECEESPCSMGKGEHPESANFLGNDLQRLGDYLCREESSEKVIVSRGQCFRTPRNKAGEGNGSIACVEECTERTSEKEQLEGEVARLKAEVDRLSQQLASAHIAYPEADLSSDQVSESFSRLEDAMLIRSQSLPEQLVTAHKKIEVLEEINDSLLAEKKEAESTLERSLKTVRSLDESLEEQRLEKFTALHGIKQLKSLLEGLKERVAKKPVHKSKSDSHSRRLPSPALEDSSLLCEIDSLQKRLASVTDEAAKEVEQTNHARQEMREMKELLDRTVAEKLELEKEVERLYRAEAEEDAARARTPPSQLQGEGVLMSEVKTLKLELARVEEEFVRVEKELQTARRDADHARQEQREMRDQLDHTVREKRVLEEKLKDEKKQGKDWKMKLDETTAKLLVKEEQFELLQDRLRR